ncbi:hypothetical protein MKW92_027782 [Papaver armeniacum]|nr:hypothetical protein MKW92_027782 [Papaver armeniacum]
MLSLLFIRGCGGRRRIMTTTKSPVLVKAEKIQQGLDPNFTRSFIKLIRGSYVTHPPTRPRIFCNLQRKDIKLKTLKLFVEDGDEYNVKCRDPEFPLGHGWRAFFNAHKLVMGDALVFHLVFHLGEVYKFKVYIVRASGVADVDNGNPAQGSVRGASVTEASEGVKLSEPIVGIQNFTNLESFAIEVNGMLRDSKIPDDVQSKYYELCRSQNAYLHKHIVEGLNCNILAEIFCDTVNIADAIRSSNLSTTMGEFEAWEKTLKFYKNSGMNVDFLLSRVRTHMQIALAFDYNGAVMEEKRLEEEITALKEEITAGEAKILQLRNDSEMLERELTTLKGDREEHESAFQRMLYSPW